MIPLSILIYFVTGLIVSSAFVARARDIIDRETAMWTIGFFTVVWPLTIVVFILFILIEKWLDFLGVE